MAPCAGRGRDAGAADLIRPRGAERPGPAPRRGCPALLQPTVYEASEASDRRGTDDDAAGRITPDWLVAHTSSAEATYYLCSPKPFLASLVHGLARLGVSAERIRCEFFGPADKLTE